MGYLVINSSLLRSSSLLAHPPAIRWAWLAVLDAAVAEDGEIHGLTPFQLSRLASISLDDATTALEVFTSPDPYSANPESEGRRLVPIEGKFNAYSLVSWEEHQGLVRRATEAGRKRRLRRDTSQKTGHVPKKRDTSRKNGTDPKKWDRCASPTPTPSIETTEKREETLSSPSSPPSPPATERKLTENQERVGVVIDTLAEAEISVTPSRAAKWISAYGWERVAALCGKVRRGFYVGKSASYIQTVLESRDAIDATPAKPAVRSLR